MTAGTSHKSWDSLVIVYRTCKTTNQFVNCVLGNRRGLCGEPHRTTPCPPSSPPVRRLPSRNMTWPWIHGYKTTLSLTHTGPLGTLCYSVLKTRWLHQ